MTNKGKFLLAIYYPSPQILFPGKAINPIWTWETSSLNLNRKNNKHITIYIRFISSNSVSDWIWKFSEHYTISRKICSHGFIGFLTFLDFINKIKMVIIKYFENTENLEGKIETWFYSPKITYFNECLPNYIQNSIASHSSLNFNL